MIISTLLVLGMVGSAMPTPPPPPLPSTHTLIVTDTRKLLMKRFVLKPFWKKIQIPNAIMYTA